MEIYGGERHLRKNGRVKERETLKQGCWESKIHWD